jgi:hypothetical protein
MAAGTSAAARSGSAPEGVPSRLMTERIAVLVNGLPGAGKTTLARTVSRRLRLPLFSKDTIMEAHADVLGTDPPPGWSQRRWNSALGAAASETMWALLADAPGDAVLESCWPKDVRHFVVQHLQRARDWQPVEIWCRSGPRSGSTPPVPWIRMPSSPGSIAELRPILRSPSPTPSQTSRLEPTAHRS